jgi:inorganic pyrophosphatase
MRLVFIFSILLLLFGCNQNSDVTVIKSSNFLSDYLATDESGAVHAVIEIPAGSNQKWEVMKDTGHLAWEQIGDSLRVIPYLPYPANYGMVPRTYLPAEDGGDDDPLDIFVLGPQRERGEVIKTRIVGVIFMLDRGEKDDKLIAVDIDSWFGHIQTLAQLESEFSGVTDILKIWMQSYKGPGMIEIQGLGDEIAANEILELAILSYREMPDN